MEPRVFGHRGGLRGRVFLATATILDYRIVVHAEKPRPLLSVQEEEARTTRTL